MAGCGEDQGCDERGATSIENEGKHRGVHTRNEIVQRSDDEVTEHVAYLIASIIEFI